MQMTFGDPCERVVTTYKLRTTRPGPFVCLLPAWSVGLLALLSLTLSSEGQAQRYIHSGTHSLWPLPDVALPHIYNNLSLHRTSLFYFLFFIHLAVPEP